MDKNKTIAAALENLAKGVFQLANAFESAGVDISSFYKGMGNAKEEEPLNGDAPVGSPPESVKSDVEATPSPVPGTVKKRTRRTKKEMQAFRLAEANKVSGDTKESEKKEEVDGNTKAATDDIVDDITDAADTDPLVGDSESLGDLSLGDDPDDEPLEDTFNDTDGLEDTFKESEPVGSTASKESSESEIDELDLFQ